MSDSVEAERQRAVWGKPKLEALDADIRRMESALAQLKTERAAAALDPKPGEVWGASVLTRVLILKPFPQFDGMLTVYKYGICWPDGGVQFWDTIGGRNDYLLKNQYTKQNDAPAFLG